VSLNIQGSRKIKYMKNAYFEKKNVRIKTKHKKRMKMKKKLQLLLAKNKVINIFRSKEDKLFSHSFSELEVNLSSMKVSHAPF